MEPITNQRIDFREIENTDAQAVIDLLTKGFPVKSYTYWTHVINVLTDRVVPPGYPRYGYIMTADDKIVGVILLIFSNPTNGNFTRCNLSSWYVEPEYRMYASILARKATANKNVVYINISSAPHTRRSIEVHGFSRFSDGVILTAGILSPVLKNVTVNELIESEYIDEPYFKLLSDHARAGCISVICNVDGECYPFIFMIRKIPHTFISCAQLIYCEDIIHFIRLAGNLGRFFLRRGIPTFLLDANGSTNGLHGIYFADRYPKYFRGPETPRLGDLTYTEFVLFGT
jgi:hypothetical protein